MVNREQTPTGELTELSLAQLRELYTDKEIHLIDSHQKNIIETPEIAFRDDKFLPDPRTDEQREKFAQLFQNKALFDDEVEEYIENDNTIQTIIRHKKESRHKLPEVTRVLRARRSIVALLFEKAYIAPLDNELQEAA